MRVGNERERECVGKTRGKDRGRDDFIIFKLHFWEALGGGLMCLLLC